MDNSGHGGFLTPWWVRRFNNYVREAEFWARVDRLIGDGPITREGIDVDTWRALPDSPNA